MAFTLNAYLPSKKREVQIKELYYKQYRELVKSLYNTDKRETIQQYNSILQELCPSIEKLDITFEDKLSLLLTIRNYCVSPDLKLKGTDVNKRDFNYSVAVENLIKLIHTVNKSGSLSWQGIDITFSSYKARDEHVFLNNNKDIFVVLGSCIDTIKIEKEIVVFKDLTYEERARVVDSLPLELSNLIHKEITAIENKYELENFLVVKNPITGEAVLRLSKNITFETLQKMIEFIFTEDLNNIYRAFYNMVKFAGFDANYIDNITPVEMQVYWMYYMKDLDEVKSVNKPESSGGLNVNTSASNPEFGF
jgi:hypothetical protein